MSQNIIIQFNKQKCVKELLYKLRKKEQRIITWWDKTRNWEEAGKKQKLINNQSEEVWEGRESK